MTKKSNRKNLPQEEGQDPRDSNREESIDTVSASLPPLSSTGPVRANDQGYGNNKFPSRVSDKIGPYHIVREIGEGGMGSVYEAEQLEPVKRRVALKVIKAGLDSKNVISRFEAERQALAIMDHPTIARIIDAGTTGFGQPFFAMELVDGVPLTTYCDQKLVSIEDRLQLFCQICDGIQHAHHKGIIHRDLKPGNILVTEYDGKPSPKIIDFGLAKALESTGKLTNNSVHTELGQVLGTIKYMSPEQAGLNGLDIDTRTDIYSLGVVLFELLTGSTPLDSSTLKEKTLFQVIELVREGVAAKPSNKIDTESKRISKISSRRQINPKRLNAILEGELDWVVMKSLDKDRERRYPTANDFGEDIRRFLVNEPVIARPPSKIYQIRKFVGKNRGLVLALTIILALLVAGISGTTYGLYVANKTATKERIAKDLALTESKRTNDVLDIVTKSFEKSTDLESGASAEMSARDVLLVANSQLEDSDLDDLGRVKLLKTVVKSFLSIGEYAYALEAAENEVKLRKTILGDSDPETIYSVSRLAKVHAQLGHNAEAVKFYQEALAQAEEVFGAAHSETLSLIDGLISVSAGTEHPEQSLEILLRVVELQKEQVGTSHQYYIHAIANLSTLIFDTGAYDKSLELAINAKDLATENLGLLHPTTIIAIGNECSILMSLGRYDEAERIIQPLILSSKNQLGKDHPTTSHYRAQLALLRAYQGRFNDAVTILEALLAEQNLDAKTQLDVQNNLGNFYLEVGQMEKGVQVLRRSLEDHQRMYSNQHIDTIRSRSSLAYGYYLSGLYNEALDQYKSVYAAMAGQLGASHPETLMIVNNLARTQNTLGNVEAAHGLLAKTYKSTVAELGADHPLTLTAADSYAGTLQSLNKLDEACELMENTLSIRESRLGKQHPSTLVSMSSLASLYLSRGDFADSVKLFEKTVASSKLNNGERNPDTLTYMNNLANAYLAAGMIDQSIKLARQTLKLRGEVLGSEHPFTSLSRVTLAKVLVEDGEKLVEALKLLEESRKHQLKVYGWSHSRTLHTLRILSALLMRKGEHKLANEYLKSFCDKANPDLRAKWQYNEITSLLGESCLHLHDFNQAKRLLEESFQHLHSLREQIPPKDRKKVLHSALGRLIELAKKTDNESDLSKWTKMLNSIN